MKLSGKNKMSCIWMWCGNKEIKKWLKPQRLKKGDKVAIVSLSAGTLGEKMGYSSLLYREGKIRKWFWFKSGCYGKYVEGY